VKYFILPLIEKLVVSDIEFTDDLATFISNEESWLDLFVQQITHNNEEYIKSKSFSEDENMSNLQRKKDILLNSFNVLNIDLNNNSMELSGIIEKMAKIDLDTACEMWRYVLDQGDIKGLEDINVAFAFGWGTSIGLANAVGNETVANIIISDSFIKRKLYNECYSPDKKIIAHLIDTNRLEEVNNILEMVYTNPYADDYEDPFGEYLNYVISVECENINKLSAELILSWMERVDSEECKAKIQLELIDYM
jgi:hypothetical protein